MQSNRNVVRVVKTKAPKVMAPRAVQKRELRERDQQRVEQRAHKTYGDML